MTLQQSAQRFHGLGANVTAVIGKRPSHKWQEWQKRGQTAAELDALPWHSAQAVGIVNGSGHLRNIDIDPLKDADGALVVAVPEAVPGAVLNALGLPANYPWCYRSKSGDGWHIWVRCADDTPAAWGGRGVYKFPALNGLAFDHVELRYGKGQTVVTDGSTFGPDLAQAEPPATVTMRQLVDALANIAELPTVANTTGQASQNGATADSDREVVAEVRRRFDVLAYAKRELTYDAETERGDNVKLGGNGGFFVWPAEGTWCCHADGVGGDCFDLVGYLEHGAGWFNSRRTHFSGVLKDAAAFAGVAMPAEQSTTPSANGDGPKRPGDANSATPAVTVGEKLPDVAAERLKRCYYREELGDGELFADLYPERLVYDHSEGEWYLWAGHYWHLDKTQQVKLLFSGQVAAQYLRGAGELTKQASEAKAAQEEQQADSLSTLAGHMMKRARSLRRVSRMKHALEYAGSLRAVTGDVWDTRSLLLPVKDGVINLETGKREPGQPDDFMRKHAPTAWKGINEPCPRFEQFILEVMSGNEARAAYLQRLFGYGISGLTTEHVFPIFWGAMGRNGKDTLLETIGYVLGDLAQPVTKDTVMDAGGRRASGAPEPHIYDLKGKRLVWASEAREGERLDAAQVKLITGGGRLKARPPYGQLVNWDPTHLVILVTNPRPHAPADDRALWSRIHLIPFNERFVDNPTGPNEHKADKQLKTKLQAEASGILAWLVRGFMAWQEQGLNPPAGIRDATEKYRQAEDTLGQFIDACCVEDGNAEARAGQLVNAYFEWCNDMGIKNPMDGRTFGEKMGERYQKDHKDYGNIYKGIGLLWKPPKKDES